MIIGTTPYGLQYAVKQSGSAVGYCALSIKCGTRDEAAYSSGIAHFTEHTLFKGTKLKSSSTINGYLEKLGGELNAFTTKEEIVIHATVLGEDLTKAIKLILELATCPSFPEKEIEKEKGVVIEEILSYKDSPADEIYDKFEEYLFAGHELSRPILGSIESVKGISSEELRRFVSEKFTPENMALTIVSPTPETTQSEVVQNILADYFTNMPPVAAPSPTAELRSAPTPKCLFDKVEDKGNHEVNAVLGAPAPSLYDGKDRFAAILLCNMLGGPASNSLLNIQLREKHGWVYNVECSYTQYKDGGVMSISLGCDKSNLKKCLKSINSSLEKLRTRELSPSALKAAKRQILGQLAISSENGEAQCLSMGKSLLAFNTVYSFAEDRAKIESITAQEVMETACRIFPKDKISKLVFL